MAHLAEVIGRHIRRIRRDHAMTQQALAKRIGVNASFIGPLEKGQKSPSLQTIERLSEVFSVPTFTFFIDDEAEDRAAIDRIRALVGSRSAEERDFLLKTLEEMVKLLRRRPRRKQGEGKQRDGDAAVAT
ncbi:MAG: helix-turn-helix transcriptional regulator [Candidatus Eremiobacteraeota bacterium]|nr:helix-turn-helix transcriptional regulator [Candidatus Eremiobacteraeota bacterium]